jgi:protein TonB
MEAVMFEDCFVEFPEKNESHKVTKMLLSVGLHALLVLAGIALPLIYTEQIQARQLTGFLTVPAPPAPPAPAPTELVVEATIVPFIEADPGAMIAPTEIPAEIAMIIDDEPAARNVSLGSTRSGSISEALGNIFKEPEAAAAPLPPPPPPPPALPPSPPVRVGGSVIQANAIYRPAPAYPPLARTARIQGVVVLEAVINREGVIDTLRVVTGPPLLIQAALDGVRTWRYRPTLLNGEAVEVLTTITVSFSLSQTN